MTKVKIEHDKLDSKIATATALFSAWIEWCENIGLRPRVIAAIPELFEVSAEEYNQARGPEPKRPDMDKIVEIIKKQPEEE